MLLSKQCSRCIIFQEWTVHICTWTLQFVTNQQHTRRICLVKLCLHTRINGASRSIPSQVSQIYVSFYVCTFCERIYADKAVHVNASRYASMHISVYFITLIPNINNSDKEVKFMKAGAYTFRMSHFLHSSWSNHNGHWNLEPQHSCCHVNVAYINKNAWSKPFFTKKKTSFRNEVNNRWKALIKSKIKSTKKSFITKSRRAYKILENAFRFSLRVHRSSAPDA